MTSDAVRAPRGPRDRQVLRGDARPRRRLDRRSGAGSVHAFVGENGAGKSTLGKIIAGVFPQDQGDLVLRGTTVSFGSPRHALIDGIALVAQEVALVPRLTVAQNVFLGAEPRRAGFIDRESLRDRFERLAADTGFDLQAGTMVGRPAARAATAGGDPARARAGGGPHRPRRTDREPVGRGDRAPARDRPRPAVARPDGHPRLAFPERGPRPVGHVTVAPRRPRRPDEPDDRRDGGQPRPRDARPAGQPDLPRQATGRRPTRRSRCRSRACPRRASRTSTLTLRAGEIVGLAGLVGAGRSELARAIYGASPTTAGSVQVAGGALPGRPGASIRSGVAMIPESRKDDGLILRATDPGERQPDQPRTVRSASGSSAAAPKRRRSATPSSG